MGVLETRFCIPGGPGDLCTLVGFAELAALVGCLALTVPSVTDFKVMPWYVPMVSILKPSVSKIRKTNHCSRERLLVGLVVCTLFLAYKSFLIVPIVYGRLCRNTDWCLPRGYNRWLWRPLSALFTCLNTMQYCENIFGKSLKSSTGSIKLINSFRNVPFPLIEESWSAYAIVSPC